ncbi:MAG: sigma factor, partial [Psychrobacillus sp.]
MEHLVRKAITGDDDAFLQLMQIHRDVLYKTAFIYLKNEHDVLEALQEVTFRAYTKRHQVKEPSFFQTWLVRILLNYCMDTLKKQGNLFSLNEDVEKEQH